MKLNNIFDSYWDLSLQNSPSMATFYGVYDYNSKLESYGLKSGFKSHQTLEKYYKKVQNVDVASLDTEEKISRSLFLEDVKSSRAYLDVPSHHLALSQMGGVHTSFLQIANVHPFRDKKDFEDYLSRLKGFSKQVKQVQRHLHRGIVRQWVLPTNITLLVIAQIEKMITNDPQKSTYFLTASKSFSVLAKNQKSKVNSQLQEAVSKHVNRPLKRLVKYLRKTYLQYTRESIGLCNLPGGDDYYALKVKQNTTLDIAPQEIHEIGLQEVARIHSEMESIQKEMGLSGSLNDFFESMRGNKDLHYSSREEIVEHHTALLKEMEKELPKYFSVLPKNLYEVQPLPEYQEKEAPDAFYMPGDSKTARPGVYFVNTYNPQTRGKHNAEALAFHEAVPGHHFQISIAQELQGIPEFRKRYNETAYVEGWALYTEKLSEEMGFYKTPEARFGKLSFEVWRASRLVVDTGIHHKGWGRQEAIDYMVNNTCLSKENIEVEIDRYIVMPGQALSYKMGEIFIMNLRKKLQEKHQDSFDIKKFHHELLCHGALPLKVLEEVMNDIDFGKN
ncbi:MAG: DUF885 domain-containing protein [Candidatus Cloacimonetes bacterium]|nr:DUF885 domain-containing protein [Candidatus Cloacimonadota bacterium]